ncbi:Nucleoporin-like 2 [Operophtera brumata]|uniref:Nucleoporin NUP42 n=1 Tax=Operophtera brumata TaxID=104452 RepID=A0A0L7L7S8_OPEBR|nr:Nucleoporin-like 2 [Operophtera brumata]
MVVCKFFQQGNCRYGQNCRFDHIYGSKYSYHANPSSEPSQPAPAVTDEQLVHQVHTDLQSMIQGGQWLLSGYAPFKEKPTFPGLVDMSPEEARLFIYEAKANNNLDQAVAYMNSLFQEAKQKYELLLSKNTSITKVLRSLYNGENVASPFGNLQQSNASFGNNNASSVFRSAVQSTSPVSVFSQSNTSSIFAQNADHAKSIFAQASQNIFQNQAPPTQTTNQQPSIFSQPDTLPQSIFAQATQYFSENTQPSTNVFNTQNAQNTAASIFANASQSIFAQSQPPFNQPSNTNVFHKPENQTQSGFGVSPNIQQQMAADTGVYNKMEDISAEDMEAFKSVEFKMGFIPEIPPPQSLCI